MGRIITLTTDFGTADGYVAEMKGVLLTIAPDAAIVDVTHDIPAQDVDFARLTVERMWLRFPAQTVHLVVVDPGVGSARAALAVESHERFLVGPDNGVLSAALAERGAHAVELPIPEDASTTFHGRDVFAPIAALLARGDGIAKLGKPAASPLLRRTPEPVRRADGQVEGEVVGIDRFGNAITNLHAERGTVLLGTRALAIRHTYADVEVGEALALIGSGGAIEIAIRNNNAARALKVSRGDKVILRPAR